MGAFSDDFSAAFSKYTTSLVQAPSARFATCSISSCSLAETFDSSSALFRWSLVSYNSPRAILTSRANSAGQNRPKPSAILREAEALDLRICRQ